MNGIVKDPSMGAVESVPVDHQPLADDQPKADKVKKPRASRAKPKLPAEPDLTVAEGPASQKKVRAPRKKADKKVVGESQSEEKVEVDQGNIKMQELPLLVRGISKADASVEFASLPNLPDHQPSGSGTPDLPIGAHQPKADEVKKRGRPAIDKFATVSARIRGGEFADASGSKAKLAIYVSRVLAEDKAFRPQMKELLTELGHVDLLSVFALR